MSASKSARGGRKRPEARWLFDIRKFDIARGTGIQVLRSPEAAIEALNQLAYSMVSEERRVILECEPDVYAGPCTEQEATALAINAAATWLWGQLWGGPDRNALLDVMAN